MKIYDILKTGSYTTYSQKAYQTILDGLNNDNITIELRLDHGDHSVCVLTRGAYADITEDDQGVRIEWYRPETGYEVTHIKNEVTHIKNEVIDL